MDLSEAQKGIATDWTQFLNLARRACPEGSATRKASDFKRAVFGAKLLSFATSESRGWGSAAFGVSVR
jgi:hypothetical protein